MKSIVWRRHYSKKTKEACGHERIRKRKLPRILERKAWGEPIGGLLITSGATLIIANLADISSMSMMGSAGFLLIFAAVNAANAVMARDNGSSLALSLIGAVLCLGAFASLIWYAAGHSPGRLWVLFGMIGTAFVIEMTFRLATGRILYLSDRR